MIAVEDQQRAVRQRVERRRHLAEHRIGIGKMAHVLRDGIVDAGQAAGPVGIVRLHGDRHQEQLLAGIGGGLDLRDDAAADGLVPDIEAEAVLGREVLVGDEAREAEAGDRPVAAEEARIVRVQEERAPAGGAERACQRGVRQPVRAQIGIEAVHALPGEGDAGEHLHFRAMGVGAVAGDVEAPLRERAAAQAVDVRQGEFHTVAAQVGEGFRLQEDDGAIAVGVQRDGDGTALPLPVAAPGGEAGGQRDREAQRADEANGRRVQQFGGDGGQQAGDAAGQRDESDGGEDRGGKQAGLHAAARRPRLDSGPGEDRPGERQHDEAEADRGSAADIEQVGVAQQRRQEAEVAEHQRLAQVEIFGARDHHEHAQCHQRRRHGEEGPRRQAEPQQPEPARDCRSHEMRLAGSLRRGMAVRRSQPVEPVSAAQGDRQGDEHHHSRLIVLGGHALAHYVSMKRTIDHGSGYFRDQNKKLTLHSTNNTGMYSLIERYCAESDMSVAYVLRTEGGGIA